MKKRALEYIERIEGLGVAVISCIESGWIQNEIQNASYQYQKDLETKAEIVVGQNEFIQNETLPFGHFKSNRKKSRAISSPA